MKVKLLVSRCTTVSVQNAGDTVTVPDDEGRRMIERGQAVPADDRESRAETSSKGK